MKTTLNLIDVNFWQAVGLLTLLCAATVTQAQTHEQFVVNPSRVPTSIVKGSDGNLWFTEQYVNKIGRMTPSGKVIEYAVPEYGEPVHIIAGPGSDLWFIERGGSKGGGIGKITTSGVITEFPVSGGSDIDDITVGPDGNLWFTDDLDNKIGKMTPAGVVTKFGGLAPNSGVNAIVTGSDGNLWFTEVFANNIGRMTISGTVTEFPVTPKSLAFSGSNAVAGPDGRVWFSEINGDRIGAITMAGKVTEYPVTAGAIPLGVSVGQDNKIWFTEYGGNKIGRMVTSGGTAGSFTEVSIPTSASLPMGIAAGPDNALYFAESSNTSDAYAAQIGRIAVSGGAISEFPVYALNATNPSISHITAGPDGNLWFTEFGQNRIGRISPQGAITEFVLPYHGTGILLFGYSSGLNDIIAGSDGNLWFTENDHGVFGNRIGRISPAGDLAEFDIATTDSEPAGITVGPDNNLWFVESGSSANRVAKITTSGTISECPLTSGTRPIGITTGSDGNLWFTEPTAKKLGRITTDGVLTEFDIGAIAHEITRGADDNLWLTEGSNLARVTTPTMGLLSYMTFPLPNSSNGITSAGKNLWITETSDDKIARITLDGSYDDFSLPKGSSPVDIVLGPDGRLWIAENGAIGKFTPDKIFADGFGP